MVQVSYRRIYLSVIPLVKVISHYRGNVIVVCASTIWNQKLRFPSPNFSLPNTLLPLYSKLLPRNLPFSFSTPYPNHYCDSFPLLYCGWSLPFPILDFFFSSIWVFCFLHYASVMQAKFNWGSWWLTWGLPFSQGRLFEKGFVTRVLSRHEKSVIATWRGLWLSRGRLI